MIKYCTVYTVQYMKGRKYVALLNVRQYYFVAPSDNVTAQQRIQGSVTS